MVLKTVGFGGFLASLLAVTLLCAGTEAAFNPCDPTLNFFPTAAEIGAPVQKIVRHANGSFVTTPCTGAANCAFPEVWSRASQQDGDMLGLLDSSYSVNNGVLKVAMKAYGGDTINPVLYFVPASPLMTVNEDVSSCVSAYAPAVRRRLQATSYKVTNPGTWSYTIKRGSDSLTSEKIGNAGKLEVTGWPAEGESCALIVTTVTGYSISNQPEAFPTSFSSTRKVCWYRNNGQAQAKLSFSQCIPDDVVEPEFNVVATDVSPAAQYLTQNGAAVSSAGGTPQLLFQPVVQIWGAYAQDLSSGPTAAPATTSSAARRLRQFTNNDYFTPESGTDDSSWVNKYFFVAANATNSSFTIATGDQVQEGYYRLSAKVSVLTKLSSLVDLQGMAGINQTDVPEVNGYTEFMGWTIINGTDEATPLVGIQKNSTLPALYSIDAKNTTTGLSFSWQFVGVQDSQACYNDGEEIPDCVTPTSVPAPADTNSTHIFTVVFTDVCGHVKNATFQYTGANVKNMTQVDYVASDISTPPTTVGTPVKRPTGAAGSAAPWGLLATSIAAAISYVFAAVL